MDNDDLLTSDQLADYLKVPVSSVGRWRRQGDGPPSVRIGKHVRYRATDVETWLEERAQG